MGAGRANHRSGIPKAAPSATSRKAPETLDRLIADIVTLHEHRRGVDDAHRLCQQRDLSALVVAGLASSGLAFQPLTYPVDALKALMLTAGTTNYGLFFDFGLPPWPLRKPSNVLPASPTQ